MIATRLYKLLSSNTHIFTPDRKAFLMASLAQTNEVSGAVVEMGCFQGMTSCLIQLTLDLIGSQKELHVYDSFLGLWSPTEYDRSDFKLEDGLFASRPQTLVDNFSSFGLKAPQMHVGKVEDLKPDDVPETISLALVDLDLYEPTLVAMRLLWPCIATGGIMIVDDYKHACWPGIKKAVEDFGIAPEQPEWVTSTVVFRKT